MAVKIAGVVEWALHAGETNCNSAVLSSSHDVNDESGPLGLPGEHPPGPEPSHWISTSKSELDLRKTPVGTSPSSTKSKPAVRSPFFPYPISVAVAAYTPTGRQPGGKIVHSIAIKPDRLTTTQREALSHPHTQGKLTSMSSPP
jgi:hypothetical protein